MQLLTAPSAVSFFGGKANQNFERNFLEPKEFVIAAKMPLYDDLGHMTYTAICCWVGEKWAKLSQLLYVYNIVLFTCSSASK